MTRTELTAALDRIAGAERGDLAATVHAVIAEVIRPLGLPVSDHEIRYAAERHYDTETDEGAAYVVRRGDCWVIVELDGDEDAGSYLADWGLRFDTKAEADRLLAAGWMLDIIEFLSEHLLDRIDALDEADVDRIGETLGQDDLKIMRYELRTLGRLGRAA